MSFRLEGDRLSIGRDFENHVQLADGKASRHHAEIRLEEDVWGVIDLGSSNGTHVNGKQVKQISLTEGDVVRIGETLMSFESDEPEAKGPTLDRALTEAEFAGFETLSAEHNTLLMASDVVTASIDDLKRANQRLRKLYELARASAAADTLGELFVETTQLVEEALEADRVFPILHQDGNWTPWSRSARKGAGRIARAVGSAPVSMSVVDTVKRDLKAVLTRAGEDERFKNRPSVKVNEIATVVCVPLVSGDRFLGVLYADRLSGGDDFERNDLEFLDAAAAYTALAIEALRTREVATRRAQALAKEVREEHVMVGEAEPMRKVKEFIERAAPSDAGVLVLGESGTGKELVAKAIHHTSRRANESFEVVNCAALSESLVESELFGHVKGAYTGATADRAGRFELAHKGTIFLDEIGELPDRIQTKLLRVLEQGESVRVGEAKVRTVDVRVVAATNRDLDEEVAQGRFRQDLFYRLNILRVGIPPLRDRGDDLDLLVEHYCGVFARKTGRASFSLSPGVLKQFRRYQWPGNVRELRNVLERLAVLVPADPITERDLPAGLLAGAGPAPQGGTSSLKLEDIEREHVMRVLERANGNKKKAAELLGIDRSTLYARLKSYDPDGKQE
jgi:transcriptional regulator with GAF, ATPase, and Fis domain